MIDYKVKQVIVINMGTVPKMRTGKLAAQAAHASMKVLLDCGSVNPWDIFQARITVDMREWINGSFAKIVLGVNSEEDLIKIYETAEQMGLPCAMIVDAGNTEFHGVPTRTAVAIGPARTEEIDKITRDGEVETRLI